MVSTFPGDLMHRLDYPSYASHTLSGRWLNRET